MRVQASYLYMFQVRHKFKEVSGITNANPGVVTTAAAHGYNGGGVDEVVLYGLTGAWSALNGQQLTVGAAGGLTFQINFDTTALGAYPGGASVMRVIDGSGPDIVAGHPVSSTDLS